jgi:hypothetical protein
LHELKFNSHHINVPSNAWCRCSDPGGPKPTSKCCVSLSWMVMQGEHTGVYPGSGKRRPYVQREGEVCISLHRGARVGVTSMRERVSSPGLKEKRGKRWLLEMLVYCFSLSVVVWSDGWFFRSVFLLPLSNPGLPFYRARGGQVEGEP